MEDLNNMEKRLEALDVDNALQKMEEDFSPLKSKPKINARIDIRRHNAEEKFGGIDRSNVDYEKMKKHGIDVSKHEDHIGFDINSTEHHHKKMASHKGLNGENSPKDNDNNSYLNPNQRLSPKVVDSQDLTKKKRMTQRKTLLAKGRALALKNDDDSSDLGSDDDDSDAESYDRSMNDIPSEVQDSENQEEEENPYEYITESKQSINILIESTNNQRWLERIKKKHEERGTISNIPEAPDNQDKDMEKKSDRNIGQSSRDIKRVGSEIGRTESGIRVGSKDIDFQAMNKETEKKKFVIPKDFGMQIS